MVDCYTYPFGHFYRFFRSGCIDTGCPCTFHMGYNGLLSPRESRLCRNASLSLPFCVHLITQLSSTLTERSVPLLPTPPGLYLESSPPSCLSLGLLPFHSLTHIYRFRCWGCDSEPNRVPALEELAFSGQGREEQVISK